jgi:putative phosphoribosyl transferase
LRREADEVICLATPETFWAVGVYYEHFEPTEDDQVQSLLREADAQHRAAQPATTRAAN